MFFLVFTFFVIIMICLLLLVMKQRRASAPISTDEFVFDGVMPELDTDVDLGSRTIHARAVYTYPLVGAYYRWKEGGIDASDLGGFVGLAKAQTDNPYDPYAIAIYAIKPDESQRHIGFLPRGKRDMHEFILHMGGSFPVIGKLSNAAYNMKPYDEGDLSWGEEGEFGGIVKLIIPKSR